MDHGHGGGRQARWQALNGFCSLETRGPTGGKSDGGVSCTSTMCKCLDMEICNVCECECVSVCVCVCGVSSSSQQNTPHRSVVSRVCACLSPSCVISPFPFPKEPRPGVQVRIQMQMQMLDGDAGKEMNHSSKARLIRRGVQESRYGCPGPSKAVEVLRILRSQESI